MNSPAGRASPTISESSSDSPENEVEDPTRGGIIIEEASFSALQPGPSSFFSNTAAPKRRFPSGFMFGGGSARDPKSRRKDVRTGGSLWDLGSGSSRSQREELVDTQVVETLRSQFGDPFDETPLKRASTGK